MRLARLASQSEGVLEAASYSTHRNRFVDNAVDHHFARAVPYREAQYAGARLGLSTANALAVTLPRLARWTLVLLRSPFCTILNRERLSRSAEEYRLKILVSITALLLPMLANLASGLTAVTTLALSPDRIGEIKTAQGITTMIRFPDPVQEIICGDLYDPATGKGTFVVQRSGATERPGNEVFIKPVASKGLSNMFVKTGDGKHTYSFDLTIVSTPQGAHRMVNVTDQAAAANPGGVNSSSANPGSPPSSVDQHSTEPERPTADFERLKAEAEQQARQKAAEILRTAQQQADRKIAESDAKIAEAERLAPQRAEQEIERRFMQALMLGLREMRVNNTKVTTAKKAVITLDPRVLLFDDKAYLRYMIQNTGDKDFIFASLSLEVVDGKGAKPLTAEVNQSKAVNSLPPGEALTGVIVFDPKQIAAKQKLTLFVRGENSAELAHLTIQE